MTVALSDQIFTVAHMGGHNLILGIPRPLWDTGCFSSFGVEMEMIFTATVRADDSSPTQWNERPMDRGAVLRN